MKDQTPEEIIDGWLAKTGGYAKDMMLRDYFAAKMLQGMVASPELLKIVTAAEVLGDEYSQRCATISYKWADAMLKARAA